MFPLTERLRWLKMKTWHRFLLMSIRHHNEWRCLRLWEENDGMISTRFRYEPLDDRLVPLPTARGCHKHDNNRCHYVMWWNEERGKRGRQGNRVLQPDHQWGCTGAERGKEGDVMDDSINLPGCLRVVHDTGGDGTSAAAAAAKSITDGLRRRLAFGISLREVRQNRTLVE